MLTRNQVGRAALSGVVGVKCEGMLNSSHDDTQLVRHLVLHTGLVLSWVIRDCFVMLKHHIWDPQFGTKFKYTAFIHHHYQKQQSLVAIAILVILPW